jgi:hypothetical protein
MAEHHESVLVQALACRREESEVLETSAGKDNCAWLDCFRTGRGGAAGDRLVERGGDRLCRAACRVVVVDGTDQLCDVAETPCVRCRFCCASELFELDRRSASGWMELDGIGQRRGNARDRIDKLPLDYRCKRLEVRPLS